MSLSSDSCLKRIRILVIQAGYQEVCDQRVRGACLDNNFDHKAAANQLIREEQLKIYLEVNVQYDQEPYFLAALAF